MSRPPTVRLAYEQDPKLCKACGKPIPYENKRNIFCNEDCKRLYLENTKEERKQKRADYMKHYNETHREERRVRDRANYALNKDAINAARRKKKD